MSADIELSSPRVSFLPAPTESERVWKLAQTIANTDFVPKTLRGNVHAITAAMLTGREIGIGPMHSLRGIDVIDGRPSLSAELMASLVMRAGHWLWVIESTHEFCTVAGRRLDWPDRIPDQDVTWSMDDAKRAGLDNKSNWKKYPRAMLRARATSELCRTIFADVVERVGYVAEELGSTDDPDHQASIEVVRDVAGDEVADELDASYADDDAVDAELVEDEPDRTPAAPTASAKDRINDAFRVVSSGDKDAYRDLWGKLTALVPDPTVNGEWQKADPAALGALADEAAEVAARVEAA